MTTPAAQRGWERLPGFFTRVRVGERAGAPYLVSGPTECRPGLGNRNRAATAAPMMTMMENNVSRHMVSTIR